MIDVLYCYSQQFVQTNLDLGFNFWVRLINEKRVETREGWATESFYSRVWTTLIRCSESRGERERERERE